MTKMITMRLTAETHARLQAQARKEYTSMTGLLLRLFDQYTTKATPVGKPDPKAHLREAYEEHLDNLDTTTGIENLTRWRTQMTNLQRAWGKDGALELPMPVDQYNHQLNPQATKLATHIEDDHELVTAQLRQLASSESLDDINFDE